MKYVALIPSYEPTDKLEGIVNDLKALNKFDIIVVNDGSNPSYDKFFDKITIWSPIIKRILII